MHKWILRMVLVALACVCAVVISCNSGGGDGGSLSGWIDVNNDGIYDPYQSYDQWYGMMNAVKAYRAQGFSLVAIAHAGVRLPWRDTNGNGVVDYAEDPVLWAKVCSAPWIDDNGDGICDNYYTRPGGGWVYLGEGSGKWQGGSTTSTPTTTTTTTTTTTAGDTIPDPFDFIDVVNQPLSTLIYSNIITVSGITAAANITLSQSGSDAEYSVNGGPWTDASGLVNNGDQVQLRVTTSAIQAGMVTPFLDIGGGVSDVWQVTTYVCFGAETKVLMADHSAKPINEVKVGEMVLAFDPATRKPEPRAVSMTFTNHTNEFLVINGALRTTAGHPFLTAAGKWIKAGEIKIGDKLRGLAGVIEVRSIKKQKADEACFNLEVEGLHTYIVSTDGKDKFVVHNY